jgi:hypothetical protein
MVKKLTKKQQLLELETMATFIKIIFGDESYKIMDSGIKIKIIRCMLAYSEYDAKRTLQKIQFENENRKVI